MQIITTSDKTSFAYFTLVNRIPTIIENIINEYSLDSSSNLGLFLKSIPNEKLSPIDNTNNCSVERKNYIDKINNKLTDYCWEDAPFFYLENYLYHKLFELANKDGIANDYFSFIKNKAVTDNIENMVNQYSIYCNLLNKPQSDQISSLLELNLLGNKADLSQNSETYNHKISNNKILINDSPLIFEQLENLNRVDIILDNSGEELFSDLILAHWLLTHNSTSKVFLHFKNIPYFVSDALISDFNFLINSLKSNDFLKKFALDIDRFINGKQIILTNNEFWSSAEIFKNMPDQLKSELSKSDLLVFKGDLNYRKLVDDRMWESTVITKNLINYLPVNSLILRVLKSEVVVGLKDKDIPSKTDNSWKYNGEYSIIEFIEKSIR